MTNNPVIHKPCELLGDKYLADLNANMLEVKLNTSRQYCRQWLAYYYCLCDRMVSFLDSQDATKADIKSLTSDDKDDVSFIKSSVGYFIEPQNLYSSWIEKGPDFDYSDVNIAIRAFERVNPHYGNGEFDDIFNAFEQHINLLAKNNFKDRNIEIIRLLPSQD